MPYSPDNLDLQTQLHPLIKAMALKDEAAFNRFYELTAQRVAAIAGVVIFSVEDRKEIVTDVFHWVWGNAPNYDPALGTVMAWISVIIRRRCIDRLRQRRITMPLDRLRESDLEHLLLPSDKTPEQQVSIAQELASLPSAILMLAPLRRRLLHMAFMEGLSHAEIANRTHLPLGSIKSHVRRALGHLRSVLQRSPEARLAAAKG